MKCATECKTIEFCATSAMRRYAEAFLSLDEKDEAQRCAEAGISPALLSRWRSSEEFRRWFAAYCERRFKERTPEIWLVVERLGRAGNLSALKHFLDRFDEKASIDETQPQTFEALARLAEADNIAIAENSFDNLEGKADENH